jgi:hypothetical protein
MRAEVGNDRGRRFQPGAGENIMWIGGYCRGLKIKRIGVQYNQWDIESY